MGSLNPFRYKLAELAPLIVSVIFLAGYSVALFVTVPIGFVPAVAALVGPVFAIVAVFTAKTHSVDDFQKALEQLKGAALTVAVYFTTVPADTANKIGILIGAVVSFFAVLWAHQKISAPRLRARHPKVADVSVHVNEKPIAHSSAKQAHRTAHRP
jgi:hypothetical protein